MGSLEENGFLSALVGPMNCDPSLHRRNRRPLESWPAAPGVGLETCLENQFGKAVSPMMSSSCSVLSDSAR